MSNEKCIIATESAKEHILKIKESKKREKPLNVGSINVIHHSINNKGKSGVHPCLLEVHLVPMHTRSFFSSSS